MATKTTKKKTASTSKAATTKSTQTTGKKRGRPSKKAQKQAEINRAWSILMFALGLILTAMAFVQGEKFWAYLRANFMFGVFGFSSYFIGIVLIYIGVLTATGKPVKRKMFWAFGFILLVSSFVQIFFTGDIAGDTLPKQLMELHEMGRTVTLSGGLMAGIIAIPMQRLFGTTAAKISLTALTATFFMFLTDTTPYDIYIRMKEKAIREKEELARQMEENRAARAEKQRAKERARAEAERQRKETARQQTLATPKARKPKKIDFEIDDKPSVDVFAEDTVDVEEKVAQTFDDVKEQKSIEQQKIDEIMKKLNISSAKTEENKEEKSSATEKTIAEIEKAKNSLTKAEKDAIVPVSEIAPELAPDDKAYIYKHPPIDLFEKGVMNNPGDIENELKTNAQKLVETLESFGVQTRIIDISRGPAVTRYELQPLAGVKISKITNLADDIALNLAASGVRIEAPIPNKAAVGIEVPNRRSSSVNIRTIFESSQFRNAASPLTIALGVDIAGNVVTT
ncbi:MAG: hypothetical protein IJD80_05375, partial [Oscillospiraceae bacterium]|nr:hypothetical protein [Oscillospiraceae bacterium]